MALEIRPNIFIEKEQDFIRLVSIPDGYEDMKDNWEWIKQCGDNTIISSSVIDTLKVVLHEYCCRLLLDGKINEEEGIKAVGEYKSYTGEEWKSPGFYYKR